MRKYIIIINFLFFLVFPSFVFSEIMKSTYSMENRSETGRVSIKTVNGKFYAYIVLLFNENPHFVNLIQKGTISLKEMGNDGFNIRAYKRYLLTIQDEKLKSEASEVLKSFLEPHLFSDLQLKELQKNLMKRNVVLRFFRDTSFSAMPLTLDYCIFGEKKDIHINHPLFDFKDEIYYIKPFIYYDEFSTSNSTFYYDMIYINPDEVENDYIIAKSVIDNRDIKSMFFVGSIVNDDIRYCLKKSFRNSTEIRKEIWRMFVIHELTHKIINNHYDNYDQITGEELSLSSTIYANAYLGLSVMYSYLNYSKFNPHRTAAINYIRYISDFTKRADMVEHPELIKMIPLAQLKQITKNHFYACLKRMEN